MLLVVYCKDDATETPVRDPLVTMAGIYPKIDQAVFNPRYIRPDKLLLVRDASSLMV